MAIRFETTLGNFTVELFDAEAPITTDNFRQYVRDGFYDGLIFHRVIPGFVVQGGGMEPGMKERPNRPAIKNEAGNGLRNLRGTLSMARTGVIDSATSQFFINVQDNPNLDHRGESPSMFGYAVFGKVIEGMEVVDRIVSVPTTSAGFHQDVPATDVVILKACEME
jgi:cyclophilin family peptidyl-prolyl cis-trans isomerase